MIPKPLRTVRSFVKRQGRITTAQRDALNNLWPIYGLTASDSILDWQQIFSNSAPIILDIGFGHGDSCLGLAQHYCDHNIVGVEVHSPGIGHCLWQAHHLQLTNLRVLREDIVTILANIEHQSLAKIYILFPDPWHKKRHHKRRLIQPAFVAQILSKLRPRGILYIATDWEDYAQYISTVVTKEKNLQMSTQVYSWRPETKYERRGMRLGHTVYDIVCMKRE